MATLNESWVRTALYLLAAGLCLVAAVRTRGARPGPIWLGWLAISLVPLGLALSGEIGVSRILGNLGRDVAWDEGWYYDRREYQRQAILAVGGAGVTLAGLSAVLFLRPRHWQLALALLGAIYLGSFVTIRAISLHDVDALLYRRSFESVRYSALFELAGASSMVLAAALALPKRR